MSSKHPASSMAELMSSYARVPTLRKGDIVEGFVKKLTPSEITLDIGAKSDALVLEFDKKNVENLLRLLKVGDKVKASVISPESEEGFPVVSLRRTLDDLIFSSLGEKYKKHEGLEVTILESARAGFFAATDEGVRGFLPASQALADFSMVGKTVKVKIIEFDKEKKRVIFSEKATEYVTDPSQIGEYVAKDQTIKVMVSGVSPHGIYCTITPKKDVILEGFIHISEVSFQRVDNLPTLFKKGDVIEALVLGIDAENRRINLSIKRLQKDSFDNVKVKYIKEQKVEGIVQEVKARGVTIELEPQVLAFIPASKIPSGVSYKKGQTVEVEISDFDDKRRVILATPVLKTKPIGYR